MSIGGMVKPTWFDHFNSPILARLAYWKAQSESRASAEQYRAMTEAVLRKQGDAIAAGNPNCGPATVGWRPTLVNSPTFEG